MPFSGTATSAASPAVATVRARATSTFAGKLSLATETTSSGSTGGAPLCHQGASLTAATEAAAKTRAPAANARVNRLRPTSRGSKRPLSARFRYDPFVGGAGCLMIRERDFAAKVAEQLDGVVGHQSSPSASRLPRFVLSRKDPDGSEAEPALDVGATSLSRAATKAPLRSRCRSGPPRREEEDVALAFPRSASASAKLPLPRIGRGAIERSLRSSTAGSIPVRAYACSCRRSFRQW